MAESQKTSSQASQTSDPPDLASELGDSLDEVLRQIASIDPDQPEADAQLPAASEESASPAEIASDAPAPPSTAQGEPPTLTPEQEAELEAQMLRQLGLEDMDDDEVEQQADTPVAETPAEAETEPKPAASPALEQEDIGNAIDRALAAAAALQEDEASQQANHPSPEQTLNADEADALGDQLDALLSGKQGFETVDEPASVPEAESEPTPVMQQEPESVAAESSAPSSQAEVDAIAAALQEVEQQPTPSVEQSDLDSESGVEPDADVEPQSVEEQGDWPTATAFGDASPVPKFPSAADAAAQEALASKQAAALAAEQARQEAEASEGESQDAEAVATVSWDLRLRRLLVPMAAPMQRLPEHLQLAAGLCGVVSLGTAGVLVMYRLLWAG